MNSLKTIYSRLTTVSSSINALNDLGIAIKNSNGEMRSASDILDDLATHWGNLSKAQQEQSAVAIAGRYQLSRFLALMNQHQQEVNALTTSIQSQGSAMRENEKYQDSMAAKINRMKTALDQLALSLGKTFVNDSFVALVQGLGSVANGVSHLVDTFGGLPLVTTAAYAGFLLFGGEARKYVTTMEGVNAVTKKFRDIKSGTISLFSTLKQDIAMETVGMSGMASATRGASIAVRALGVAFREALIASGVGIAIVAISYGIEKLIEYTNKQKEEAKKLKEEETQLVTTYKSHADEISNLADKYRQLSQEVDAGTRTKNDKEYLDTQQSLSKLLPNVVSSVDAVGQAHLKSASAVDREVESLKKLSTLDSQKFVEGFEKKLDDLNNKILDTQTKIKKFNLEPTSNTTGGAGLNYDPSLDQVKFKKTPLTAQDQENNIIYQRELSASIQQRVDLFKQLSSEYQSFLGVQDTLTKSDNDYINSLIENNKAQLATKKGSKEMETQIKSLVGSFGELRDIFGSGADLSHIFEGLSSEKVAVLSELVKGYKNGGETVQQFTKLMEANGFSMDQVIAVTNALTDAQKTNAKSTDEVAQAQQTLTQILSGSLSVEDALAQSLLGYTKDQIDSNSKLIEIYAALSKAKNLDANQSALLAQVYDELKSRFPDLVKGHEISVNALYGEANAQSVLYQAVIASANGQLDAEHQKTLGMALELQNQKKIVEAQIALYQKGLDAYVASEMVQNNGRFAMNGAMMANYHRIQDMANQVDNVIVPKIQKAAISLGKYLNVSPQFKTPSWDYGSSGSKGSKGTKGSKSTADTQAVNKYQTDAFSQALANLDLQLKESDARLGDLDKSSQAYRDELKHQIDLIEQEEKLTKGQIDSLNKKNTALKHQLSSMGAYNKLSNAQKQTYNDIAKAIDDNINKINDLSGAMVDYGNKVKDIQGQVLDSFSAVNDMITNNINTAMQASDDSYDSQIKKLQDKLDLMDQEYAKEDRIAKLRDLQNQIDTAKADKRFEYINAQGQVELTYDKAKVSDLQKQQDELIKQYNREDAKQAIQDEIDRLQKEKDDKHKLYEQQISDMKDFWDTITKAFQDGSLTLDEFMKDFYGKSLEDITKYAGDVGKQTEIIKQLFSDLSKLSVDSAKYGTGMNPGDKVDPQKAADNNNRLKNDASYRQSEIDRTKAVIYNRLKQGLDVSRQEDYLHYIESFHTGGIVSSSPNRMTEIANKLLNTKLNPNEQVIKVLKGELLSPAANIAQNLIPNLRMLVGSIARPQPVPVSADNHYHFNNLTIKSNNMTEFLNDIHFLTRTKRT